MKLLQKFPVISCSDVLFPEQSGELRDPDPHISPGLGPRDSDRVGGQQVFERLPVV